MTLLGVMTRNDVTDKTARTFPKSPKPPIQLTLNQQANII